MGYLKKASCQTQRRFFTGDREYLLEHNGCVAETRSGLVCVSSDVYHMAKHEIAITHISRGV